MRKKHFTIIVCMLMIAVLAISFTACNKYQWDTVSGGDSSANVLSNGGYAVQQGNHVYFVNGFQGATAENGWGSVYKQGIMRATLKADGELEQDSLALVVPKLIYSSDKSSGIAIFGEWIYYATPNNDKDKTGTASTTNLDFMRTKIDGSITQKIYTLPARSYPYIFTPTRILYYNQNTIFAIDFTGMKTNKSITDASGVRSTLASGVTSYTWKYDADFALSQGSVASDYVVYTVATTDNDQSYRFSNELNIIKADGTEKKNIANFDTFTQDYKIELLNAVAESDNTLTIYYTKTKRIGSEEVVDGVFCNKIVAPEMLFDVTLEKQLTVNAQSTIFPISYELGALVTDGTDSFVYYLNGTAGVSDTYSRKVIGKTTATVQFVINDGANNYVYYTDSGDAKSLFRINLLDEAGLNPNEVAVLSAGTIKTDWTKLDLIKTGTRCDFYYFNTDDYSYLHRVDLSVFDGTATIKESKLFGKMTDKDAEAKEKAEKEKAEAKANS